MSINELLAFRAKVIEELVAAIAEPVTDYPRSGPGVIISMTERQQERLGLPRTTALLVLAEEDGQMTVCPLILFPFPKFEVRPGDLWLESNKSPFRSFPGTGRAFIRTGMAMTVPVYYGPDDVITGLKPEIMTPFISAWRAMDQ